MENFESIKKLENWLNSYLNFEKTPKKNIFWLKTMEYFCEKLGNPQNYAPCFHIAGSKGKGSISAFISAILDETGYKTGIYTSPHILNFIERVSSSKGPFSENVYEKAVKKLMDCVNNTKISEMPGERDLTWFELVTLFSFLVFRQAEVDYSVFEVGLGGRLDSTNVVNPICACIGPIELEHTEFLGDTLEKIAGEKGGIIKKNSTVIIARQNESVKKVFEKIAEEKNAKLYFFDDVVENLKFNINNTINCLQNNTFITNDNLDFTSNSIKNYTILQNQDNTPLMSVSFSSKFFKREINTQLRLLGSVQAENAALAAIAVKKAIPSISEDLIERGLSKATLPGRFEIIKNIKGYEEIPYIILDGAHTVNSINLTLKTFNELFSNQKSKSLLFACAADKDVKDIVPLFKNQFSKIFLTKPGNVKQSDLKKLESTFCTENIDFDSSEDFERQIKKAMSDAKSKKSILLVTGSFYLIAEVKKIIESFKEV